MSRTPVLIVGAGPTGLVLALNLARRGVSFRIVSATRGPGEHSRAMVVHARTLEFYRQLGFADEVVERGVKVEHAHLREGGVGGSREIASVTFKDIGAGLSPYPFPLCFPQDDHERLLVAKLRDAGVEVQWRSKLVDFTQDASGVTATVTRDDGTAETIEADYICGCDGARSVVRQTLQLAFSGGTYRQLYFVADVEIAGGFREDLFINLGAEIFALLLPVRSTGMQRLIGTVPVSLSDRDDLDFEDLRAHVEPLVDAKVTDVNWFSTYRVHHRVADQFRVGRAFIAGDAGHVHSPAGGQGMNTGIGDATNLGWKLAAVIQRRASESLLDSYEAERIGFARKLVTTTDRAFTLMVGDGLKGQITRRFVIPLLFEFGTRFAIGRRAFFRTLSQIQIDYEDSDLSQGQAGHVRAGDRLPWVSSPDNFDPLRSLDWQVHLYGEADQAVRGACEEMGLPTHVFPWSEAAEEAGLRRKVLYLVRPDGYVAFAEEAAAVGPLEAYVRSHGLSFGPLRGASTEPV